MSFVRDNHYVSQGYLKRWADSDGKVWVYSTLVSNPKVPIWAHRSRRGIAYHTNLYTRYVAGQESDDIEKWLDQSFETPAEEPIRKTVSNSRLSPEDWKRLINFLAAQDVRTPAWFIQQKEIWQTSLPPLMEEALTAAVQKIEEAHRTGQPLPKAIQPSSEDIPVKSIVKKAKPGEEMGEIGAKVLLGRDFWMRSMRRTLTKTIGVLHEHKWTILVPPEGLTWFTSDNPVVKLVTKDGYHTGGGWGLTGTEIFLPLSPHHLMYTRVGERPPQRGEKVPLEKAWVILEAIARHAYRRIFAAEIDAEIPTLRPRIEDSIQYQREAEQWKSWHPDQIAAEQAFENEQES